MRPPHPLSREDTLERLAFTSRALWYFRMITLFECRIVFNR
jgi:hypothetical protein